MFQRKILWILCMVLMWENARAISAVPGLPSISDSSPSTSKQEPSEDARLQQWLTESKATLDRLDNADAEKNLPEGVSASALADRKRDLEQIIRVINRATNFANIAPSLKKAKEDAVSAEANWTNFEKPGPYSIILVDDLANQLDAAKDRSSTFQSSIAIFQPIIDGFKNDEKSSGEALAAAERALTTPSDHGADDPLRHWQKDIAKEKFRLNSARRINLSRNLENVMNQAAAADADLKLLTRKLKIAKKDSHFTEDDLKKIQSATTDRLTALDKEKAALQKRMLAANAARIAAQAAFDKLPPVVEETGPSEERNLATLQLSVAEAKINSLQYNIDSIDDLKSVELMIPQVYSIRKRLVEANTIADRIKPAEDLKRNEGFLDARAIVTNNAFKALMADISTLNSVSSSIPASDPRFALYADMRTALWDKQAAVQRFSQVVVSYQKMLGRWYQEFQAAEQEKPWSYQVQAAGNKLWRFCKQIWDLQIGGGDLDKDGVPQQGVPLGKIFIALLVFVIGYLIATAFSKRVLRIVVARGHIAEAQANTLRNWSMIIVSCVLAFTTLQLLSIPLTLFAFFGGALAIGLGFGTQTLIKNFISGIIVLFERKIRVGDILTVGSVTGKIIEINTRSSVLRGVDGMETLIPNSVFLENQVANLTLSNRCARKSIKVGVAYGSQPQQVAATLKECVERHGNVLKEPEPQVLFEDFAADALIFSLEYWVEYNTKTDVGMVASDIRFMIEKRFSELGIHMPFPQRELHVTGPLEVSLTRREKLPQSANIPNHKTTNSELPASRLP